MPKHFTKKHRVTTRLPYFHSSVGTFSPPKTGDSNILGKDDAGYEFLSAAVMLLDLSDFDAETYPLPQDVSKTQPKSPVKIEGDGGVVEEALTQPENREEMMLIYPIAVYSCPSNGHGASLTKDMGCQVLEFQCSFQLDLTCMVNIVTLSAPSQSFHGPPASCGASKMEEALLLDLVDDNEDRFVYNRDSPHNRLLICCGSSDQSKCSC